jgi:flagellar biosynthesis protein FlhG
MDGHNIPHDAKQSPVQVVAVTSGKGGVGKTNVSINIAVALANRDRRVMLMDADLGLANIDVVLGLQPKYNLSHVLDGVCTLQEVIMQGPSDIQIVPASSGIQRMSKLTETELAGLIYAFSEFRSGLDTLVIDTAAGISDHVLSFSRASNEVLVVVCDEPASITDAYALIKVLNRDQGLSRFRILANMVQSKAQGHELFTKLLKVANRFLDVTLDYVGMVPNDEYLRKAVQRRWPVVNAFPRSRSASAFTNLAAAIDSWPIASTSGGRLEFFFERLVGAEARSVS